MAQKTLEDLRSLSCMACLLGPFLWAPPFSDLFSGLVWVEDQHVVGNVTLTRSRGGGPGCWLISNVVVAPAYRGQGIGRALMEEALTHILSEGGRRAILQVRADNSAATHLYRDLGFAAVDTLLEMFLFESWSRAKATVSLPRTAPMQERGYDDGLQEYLLAREAIPAAAQEMHPLHRRSFRVGWDERIVRLLRNVVGSVREYRMGISEQGVLWATLNVWASRWLPYHRLQIMVHPQHRGEWEQDLVDQGLRLLQRHRFHPVYAEAYAEHGAMVKALRRRGFVVNRELVQMTLDIVKASRV